VARHGDNILGSAVKKGTSHTNFFGEYDEGLYDGVEGVAAAKVCSDNLFAFSKRSGAVAWTYTDGVIINSTITIGAGRVYFVETRNAKVKASSSRRVSMPEMWLDQFLVALDVDSGAKVWQRAIDTADGEAVIFLAHGKGRLVLVSSGGPPTGNKNQYGEVLKKHYIYAYDPPNGEAKWDTSFEWSRPRKAEHMSRPVVVGDTLFIWPHVLNLTTGKVLPQRKPLDSSGFSCGTSCAVAQGLFMGNTYWNAQSEKVSSWPRLRSSCWLSTIPAAGMLLSPEGGGGCSCGSWLETSIGFMPVARSPNRN
jgi:outer membrane protein assembly factor BamB